MRNNICLFLLGVVVSVGMSMSFNDELSEQELYCEMVGSGAWGDYKQNYNEVCDVSE